MDGIVTQSHIDRSKRNFGYEGMSKDPREVVLQVPGQVEELSPGRFNLDDYHNATKKWYCHRGSHG